MADITALTNQSSATDGATALAGIKTAVTNVNNGKADLASPTFTGTVTLPSGQALIAPALGTPASGVMTNVTGTASGLTAGTVTTNANLTGDVSSSGNATTIGAGKVTEAMQVLADNTTNDASTSKHGYLLKLDNVATHFMDGTGAWSAPATSVVRKNGIATRAGDTSSGNQTIAHGLGVTPTKVLLH